ncbi:MULTISPECIES: M20/M25/M40 family metallo-hydrolase [unclassified Arthrobacter]|uniref:M20/M25/M40 family metallo-hydrolase n=1 Tax=unclassified Arthrobacter TaxID=235627 RepID=UPI001F40EF56|nr:M20/M25/M40 family metallo-hydrolase [Arthrobacter sp. FW305-BF8]UKA52340.1 M20/M25/M40 family metallo-hydrolase [Arthrobacter sp. FW305-BF8]
MTLPAQESPLEPRPTTTPVPDTVTPAPKDAANQVRAAFANSNLIQHLEELQKVADDSGGNRAAGTAGYEASARYVEDQLRDAGYKPVRQVFTYRDHNREADVETFNILAETAGNPEHTIVVGGHLDSVRRGPGINDNASGVAAIIETARWMAETGVRPKNRVRFAFWGAEEVDLLGSRHYVDTLTDREISQTMLDLNLDMVASSNGGRFVHDGDGSSFGNAGPRGSGEIERQFLDYFARNSLAAEATEFDGESDYEPFIGAGIPAGGLFSGDDDRKNSRQVTEFGGIEGEDHDPCYHSSCDDIENIDPALLKDMAGALGYVTLAFAMMAPP